MRRLLFLPLLLLAGRLAAEPPREPTLVVKGETGTYTVLFRRVPQRTLYVAVLAVLGGAVPGGVRVAGGSRSSSSRSSSSVMEVAIGTHFPRSYRFWPKPVHRFLPELVHRWSADRQPALDPISRSVMMLRCLVRT